MRVIIFATILILTLIGCSTVKDTSSRISLKPFGKIPDGQEVTVFTITNALGSSVDILDLGGIIVALKVPDRDGKISDVVLGLDNPTQYLRESPYFGAIVGRYANRIREGKFRIDGKDYSLAINNDPNALHGGLIGFDKRIWKAEPFEGADYAGLNLSIVSQDGDEGYPGTLNVSVSYRFDDNNTLTINYKATTDKKTVINLSQHSYFNLNGHSSGSITDHEVTLNASHYTPVDETLIPVGGIVSVDGTPMDFRNAKTIGRDINIDHEQLVFGGGYDHNWVLDPKDENELVLAATVFAPKTGRFLEVMTNQPGIQFYTGNFLDGAVVGKEGVAYEYRNGFCLETQHFPDSPNQPEFPTAILNSEDVYNTTTVLKFSIR